MAKPTTINSQYVASVWITSVVAGPVLVFFLSSYFEWENSFLFLTTAIPGGFVLSLPTAYIYWQTFRYITLNQDRILQKKLLLALIAMAGAYGTFFVFAYPYQMTYYILHTPFFPCYCLAILIATFSFRVLVKQKSAAVRTNLTERY